MGDMIALRRTRDEFPHYNSFLQNAKQRLNVDVLPKLTGSCRFGRPVISLNSCEYVQDLFVNKNAWLTKSQYFGAPLSTLARTNLITLCTFDPIYDPSRKALASIFHKQKMQGMIQIIKECALRHVKQLQTSSVNNQFDLVTYTQDL